MSVLLDIYAWCADHWIICLLCAMIAFQKYKASANAKMMENIKGSKVKKMESEQQWTAATVAAEGKLVLCDFYATWCPPCVKAAPTFAKWSQEYEDKDVEFWKVDVDGSHTLGKKQRISCMPTFKFYRASKGSLVELETIQGWAETQIRGSIDKYMSS